MVFKPKIARWPAVLSLHVAGSKYRRETERIDFNLLTMHPLDSLQMGHRYAKWCKDLTRSAMKQGMLLGSGSFIFIVVGLCFQ